MEHTHTHKHINNNIQTNACACIVLLFFCAEAIINLLARVCFGMINGETMKLVPQDTARTFRRVLDDSGQDARWTLGIGCRSCGTAEGNADVRTWESPCIPHRRQGVEPPSHGCHGRLLPLQAWRTWGFGGGCHAGGLKLRLCGQQCPCGDDSSQRLSCSQVPEPLHSHPLEVLADSITRAVDHVFTEGFDIRDLLPHIASKAKRWRWRRSRCGGCECQPLELCKQCSAVYCGR